MDSNTDKESKEIFSKLTYRQRFAITEYGYLLSPENAEIVGKMLGDFREKDVLPFCQANGIKVSGSQDIISKIHDLKEKEKQQVQGIENPKSNMDLLKYGSSVIVPLIVTMASNAYFDNGCKLSNYQGNLFLIFIVTWISWMGLLSLVLRGKNASSILLRTFVSLVIIVAGAFFCIVLTGFWIAPVCN